jgi:hypothetical protein
LGKKGVVTVLKTILGTKRVDITEEWRKFHDKKLHNLYSSANIIRVIKS